MASPSIAIVDYGMGNLCSVQLACMNAGTNPVVTADPDAVVAADGVILPGVGAMPDAMRVLRSTGLDKAVRHVVERRTPFLGICLGMQLLMTEGSEFGAHEGLGLVEGTVERFHGLGDGGRPLRVPHIGWNAVRMPSVTHRGTTWSGTLLQDTADHTYMYFVHSYYVAPTNPGIVLATTRYGGTDFCSAIAQDNIFASQFHPERSGSQGLDIIRHFVSKVTSSRCLTHFNRG